MQKHLCWPPYFLPWPRSGPPSFFILESPLVLLCLFLSTCIMQSVCVYTMDFFKCRNITLNLIATVLTLAL